MASYADILFGKIVVKNGLAPLATVQECLQIQESSKARGLSMTLPEVMVARAAITEDQARLASRAQALTQLQRAESIYAKIVHERGLVPFQVLQECFAQQKQRRFAVRISQILLERGLLTSDQNEEIVEEQLVRLGEETRLQEEAGLSGSTPLMEDSRVQRLTAEQQRLQDLAASTFRNAAARTPAGYSFTGSTPDARGRGPEPGRPSEPAREARSPDARPAAQPPLPAAPPPGSFRTASGRVASTPRPEPPPPPPQPRTVDVERTIELDVPSAFAPGIAAPVSTDDLASWGADSKNARRAAQAAPEPKKAAAAGPVDPASLTGKTISSRYRILDKLGEGGMGTVYKAEHCLMEKIVAFKVLHPHLITNKQSLERFRREVRAASKFQHKNVIQIYDAGEGEGGIFYMAMEFIEGVSLESLLQKGPLPIDRTLTILRQTLKALGEAHKKGIVHRDMKSDNIMITKGKHGEDLVKVMDFGIAKILDQESSLEAQNDKGDRIYKTMEGVITGTPQYMSPEQAEGKKVDHRSDLYSLGCILFEMLTGRLPFESETAMGFLGKHIVEEPPLPSSIQKDVPPALENVVMKLLRKEPDERYQTAGEIWKDLDDSGNDQYGQQSSEEKMRSAEKTRGPAPAPASPPTLAAKPVQTLSVEEAPPAGVAEKKGPPTLVLALLGLALLIALGGGGLVVWLVVKGPDPKPSPRPRATPTPEASSEPTPAPTPTPSPSAAPTPSPSPSPSSRPTLPPPGDATPTPSPDRTADPAAADRAEKEKAFAAALKGSLDALVALDLDRAQAGVEEARKLAPDLGDEARGKLDARAEAVAAVKDAAPHLAGARAALDALAKGEADPAKREAAQKGLDDWQAVVSALRDQDAAQALADVASADRARLREARDKAPADDPLRPWRDSVARFRDQQLPGLVQKRQGDAITGALYDLRSAAAFAKSTPAEQKWIVDALARFTTRAKAWGKIPARYVMILGGPYTLARSTTPGGKPDTVTLPDYSVDSVEATQADWNAYLEAVPSAPRPQGFEGPVDLPMGNVSADEIAKYAEWLSKKTDGLVTFRLPSEAEWERAARGSQANDYPWGADYRPERDSGRAALGGALRKVRAFEPNDLGLYDTCGNVAELTGTLLGGKRVVKGGSVHSSPERARAGQRELVAPGEKTPFLGFRLVALETGEK